MPLVLDENQAAYQIHAYKPGFIQVNETILTQSIIVSTSQLITDWAPQTLSELTAEHLQIILTLKPAILLIGTGATLSFPAVELYGELLNQGIGVEIMDTSAACRTYNALTAESRNVVAALIIK
jgi:uncharacterized protein